MDLSTLYIGSYVWDQVVRLEVRDTLVEDLRCLGWDKIKELFTSTGLCAPGIINNITNHYIFISARVGAILKYLECEMILYFRFRSTLILGRCSNITEKLEYAFHSYTTQAPVRDVIDNVLLPLGRTFTPGLFPPQSTPSSPLETFGSIVRGTASIINLANSLSGQAPQRTSPPSESTPTQEPPKPESSFQEPKSERVSECVVCFEAEPRMTFFCGHLVCCKKCTDQLDDCPICRAKLLVNGIKGIYTYL